MKKHAARKLKIRTNRLALDGRNACELKNARVDSMD